MAGVFEEAYSSVEAVNLIVNERIQDANLTADMLTAQALQTVSSLKNVNFAYSAGAPPVVPTIDPLIEVSLDLPAITPTSFGEITSNLPDRPVLFNVLDVDPLDIPDFVSSISSLTIPLPPPWTAPGDPPEAPATDEVIIPEAPTLTMPSLPVLVEIDIPTFDGLSLPIFTATSPAFQATAIPGILQWDEPIYATEIIEEAMTVIRSLWTSDSGLPPAVELAMIERAASREDMLAAREIDAVDEEFSLKGFTMPTGMQAARVDQMRQELVTKKLSLNRELTIKFAEMKVENIKFAVTQAIAAENVFVNIFLNSAERLFNAAKFRVDAQMNIYNAQVALYSAQMNGYQIEAQVFDTRVKAELTKIEVFRAEIEAEVARGQINEQKVRTYTAQVGAVQTEVDVFKARMQGAQVQSDVVKNQIEAYRAAVQAYAERIQADKVRFEAYESQIKGEVAKAGIIDSEARAYAAMVGGKSTAAEIDIKRAELIIQRNRQLVEVYAADLDVEKTKIQSQVAVITAGASAYTADTQRFSAQAGAETAKAQIIVSAKEAEQRTSIAFFEAQVQYYISNMQQLIQQTATVLDALKAAGQITSTMAAGAMAGVHVGATLSGSGQVGASGAYSQSVGKSDTTAVNTNYNFEGTGL